MVLESITIVRRLDNSIGTDQWTDSKGIETALRGDVNEETHLPHTMMLPPPCFIVGTTCSRKEECGGMRNYHKHMVPTVKHG